MTIGTETIDAIETVDNGGWTGLSDVDEGELQAHNVSAEDTSNNDHRIFIYNTSNHHKVFVVRAPGEPLDHPQAVQRILGIPKTVNSTPSLPLTFSHIRANNIICDLHFDTQNAAGVKKGLHENVSIYGQQLRMSHIIYTIFGTVSYQLSSSTLECSGIRNLNHVTSLSTTIHNGSLRGITITRYCVDSAIGRYVEVSDGCFMERMIRILYQERGILVAPRLDETTNASHLRITNLEEFLQSSNRLGIISCGEEDSVTTESAGVYQDIVDEKKREIGPQLSVTVLITRTGACTYRFSFADTYETGVENIKFVEILFQLFVRLLNKVLHRLC